LAFAGKRGGFGESGETIPGAAFAAEPPSK
jgi:hypothetical protein